MDTETIVAQIGLSGMVFAANTTGISHEESLTSPHGGGNCLNWVVGHLVKSRHDVLSLLSASSANGNSDEFTRYAQGGYPLVDPTEATAFPALTEEFAALQQPLIDAIRNASPETLAQPIPNSPSGNDKETIGSLVVATAFHEAYHLGQAGLLRRMLGKKRNLP